MAYTPIAQAIISLQSSGITGQGFGIPLFIAPHINTFDKVVSLASMEEVAELFDPISASYRAAQSFFANTPRPSIIKIARQDADFSVTYASGTTSASLVVKFLENGVQQTQAVDATGADANAVATSVETILAANASLSALITVTVTGSTVLIEPTVYGTVTVEKDLSELGSTTTLSNLQSITDTYNSAVATDPDFYFVTAADKTKATRDALSLAVSASSRIYFTSILPGTDLATEFGSPVTGVDENRVVVIMHQDAASHPECSVIGYQAAYDAGTLTWSNLRVNLAFSKDLVGNNISTSLKGDLETNKISYVDNIGGLAVLRGGKVLSGESIDTIRGRDSLISDIKVSLTNLLINQQGTKIPYNDSGILLIEVNVRRVLETYVLRGFINANYTMNFLNEDRVPLSDKQQGIYRSGSFTAELSGAINTVSITGALVLDLAA